MLDSPTRQKKVTLKAQAWRQAWRVDFQEHTSSANSGSIAVKEPRNLTAVFTPVDPEEGLATASSQYPGSLTIVWMPPGVNAPPSIERDVEAWTRGGASSRKGPLVRAGIRTVRVFMDDNRALIYAGSEQLQSAIDAVVRFTVAQRETLALELTMSSTWASVDADAPLTHSVTSDQQKHQRHANEMTELSTRMKAMHLRISQALEQLDATLEDSSKRIYAELVLAAGLWERIEQLEEPIEFAMDHYEVANTRLIEAKYAAKEQRNAIIGHVLEAGIILLLLYQNYPLVEKLALQLH
jgi:hypothetical protein